MTLLRQRMTEDMRLRNLGPHTQRAYLQYVSQFAGHFHKSPEMLGPAEIRAFQLHLNRDRQLSASSVGVAVASPLPVQDHSPTGMEPRRRHTHQPPATEAARHTEPAGGRRFP
jgi:hypothetical protein